MLKSTSRKIVFFFFIKYLIFYILMMFKNNNFSLIQFNTLRNFDDILYYCLTFLFYPLLCIILFLIPIYFALNAKKPIYFILLISIFLITEYTIYTYLDSQLDLMNGFYNELISLVVFILVFYKKIVMIFKRNPKTINTF